MPTEAKKPTPETACLSVDTIVVLATQKDIKTMAAAHLAGVNCALAGMDEETAEAEFDSIRKTNGVCGITHNATVRRELAMAFFKGWEAIARA